MEFSFLWHGSLVKWLGAGASNESAMTVPREYRVGVPPQCHEIKSAATVTVEFGCMTVRLK